MDAKRTTINVLLCKAGERAKMVEIQDSLESFQEIVGGMIEEYMPFEDDAALVCNEEGKMRGLPLNRAIDGEDGKIIDVIAGDFFICYAPIESEKFLSLPPEMAEKYLKKFDWPEQIFLKNGEGLVAHKYNPDYRKQEVSITRGNYTNEPTYTYCTKEQWNDEFFDFDWCKQENGSFTTLKEAQEEAKKHGAEMVISVEEDLIRYGNLKKEDKKNTKATEKRAM